MQTFLVSKDVLVDANLLILSSSFDYVGQQLYRNLKYLNSHKIVMDSQARCELLKGYESVLVKVGPSGEDCWTFQKNILITQSTFFKVALSGEWREANSHVIELPEDEPTVFEIFVRWIFTGETGVDDHEYPTDGIAQKVAQAWILGEKLECPLFKELLLDNLITMYHKEHVMDRSFIDCAFSGSLADSKLCRFAVIQFIMDSMCRDPRTSENHKEWDNAFPSTMTFGIELARLMPYMYQYLYRWFSNGSGFSRTGDALYRVRLKLLIKRRPTYKEIEELDD